MTATAARAFAAQARSLIETESNVFWLDAGPRATRGVSYLGSASRVLTVSDGRVVLDGEVVGSDLLAVLRESLPSVETGPGRHPFRGGWVGWFSYEYGADLVGAPRAPGDLPDAVFLECDRLWSFDHATGAVESILATRRAPVGPPPVTREAGVPRVTWRHDRRSYLDAIAASQAAIARGDAYQICLTNEARISAPGDALETYLRLREDNPAPYGGFVRGGGVTIASCSPEQFLRVDAAGTIVTRPIKGTRRRDPDPAIDADLAEELASDDKERAENLMIVDLMRNDLGRVARLGSVDVTALFAVESFSSVHQLVSTVQAELDPAMDSLDLVGSAFPAGSMTGAPKHRAMSILHDLEHGPRGVYSGAFGWIGADGALDLAMVIRTIVFADGQARIGTGGGITALSRPDDEVAETLLKAAPLLEALGLPVELTDRSH
ncbi:aminodeoxychorismate synthase component I [Labedella phragmitis]|uniref:aminodeoxychorismate synthase n=1 Tax=Labedella phragmitis TaxID=2498849 RepID=A0A3S3ZRA0_9MICO|nr:aminodeoxychorismate synthase component I [Labedella phragmitis]RWZ51860.1 aminodeoxychorismate synthase component I [Labedella phragmitis]